MTKKELTKQEAVRIGKLNLKYLIKKNSPVFFALSHMSSAGAQYYRMYTIGKKHRGIPYQALVDITDDYAAAICSPYHPTERKHNALYVRSSPGNNIERNLEKMGIKVSNRVYL